MCRVYISDKDEVRWYSQKQQKKCELYDTTEVSMKRIATLDQINIKEVDIHDIQKEDFSKYNEEVYISEDYKFNKANIRQKEI